MSSDLVTVPIEPTEEMIKAGADIIWSRELDLDDMGHDAAHTIYQAMLEAYVAPPVEYVQRTHDNDVKATIMLMRGDAYQQIQAQRYFAGQLVKS